MGRLVSSVDQLVKLRDQAPSAEQRARGQFRPRTEEDVWRWFDLTPAPHQRAMNADRKRFRCDVVHRRGGKTVSKVVKLVTRAYACPFPNGRYAYIAPTYSQAEDIAWAYLRDFAERIPGAEIQLSKLAVLLPTARGDLARIRLYGLDSPKQRLRGGYLDGAVADEAQDLPEVQVAEQIRPMLADKSRKGVDMWGHPNQWLDLIGTPKGRNYLYRAWAQHDRWGQGLPVALKDEATGEFKEVYSDEHAATLLPWHATGMIDPAEIGALQAQYGETFPQEFEVSFTASLRGAIYGYELTELRKLGRIGHVPVLMDAPVHTAWDLGWNDHTAIWFFQQLGETWRFIDYWEGFNASIPRLRQILQEKGYLYGRHYFPHDVEVHELGSGKSRAATFRENGIRVTAVRKLPLPDQIAAARKALWTCAFDGDRCQRGLDMLALYHRAKDEKTGLFKEEPVHNEASHCASAFAVFAVGRPATWQQSLRAAVAELC